MGGDVLAVAARHDRARRARSNSSTPPSPSYGRLDIVVANAGGPPPGRALDVDDEAAGAAVNANLLTSVRLVRAALPHLRARGVGPHLHASRRCTVKQPIAVPGAVEHGPHRAVGVGQDGGRRPVRRGHHPQPGLPRAPRHRPRPGGGGGRAGRRMGDPADFGKVVAFLCSEPARFVSGVALDVDGATVAGLL